MEGKLKVHYFTNMSKSSRLNNSISYLKEVVVNNKKKIPFYIHLNDSNS